MKTADVDMPNGVTLSLDFPDDASDEQINATIQHLHENGKLQPLYEEALKAQVKPAGPSVAEKASRNLRRLETGIPLRDEVTGKTKFASPEFTARVEAEQAIRPGILGLASEVGQLVPQLRPITELMKLTGSELMKLTGSEDAAVAAASGLAMRGKTGMVATDILKNTIEPIIGLKESAANLFGDAQTGEPFRDQMRSLSAIEGLAQKSAGAGTGMVALSNIIGQASGFASGMVEGAAAASILNGSVRSGVIRKALPKIAEKLMPTGGAIAPTRGAAAVMGALGNAVLEEPKALVNFFGAPEGATPEQVRERRKSALVQAILPLALGAAGGYAHAIGGARRTSEANARAVSAAEGAATKYQELGDQMVEAAASAGEESPAVKSMKAVEDLAESVLVPRAKELRDQVETLQKLSEQAKSEAGDQNAQALIEFQVQHDKFRAAADTFQSGMKALDDLTTSLKAHEAEGHEPFKVTTFALWEATKAFETVRDQIGKGELADFRLLNDTLGKLQEKLDTLGKLQEKLSPEYIDAQTEGIQKMMRTALDAAKMHAEAVRAGLGKEAPPAPKMNLSPRDRVVQAIASLDDAKNAEDGLHLLTDIQDKSGLKTGEFHAALSSLAEDGVVQLQSHDRPSDLTPQEKATWMPNKRGSFVVASGFFHGERAKYQPKTGGEIPNVNFGPAWDQVAKARESGIEAQGIAQAEALREQTAAIGEAGLKVAGAIGKAKQSPTLALSTLFDEMAQKSLIGMMDKDPGFAHAMREFAFWDRQGGAPGERMITLTENLLDRMESEIGKPLTPKYAYEFTGLLERAARQYLGQDNFNPEIDGAAPLKPVTAPEYSGKMTLAEFIKKRGEIQQQMKDAKESILKSYRDMIKSAALMHEGTGQGRIDLQAIKDWDFQLPEGFDIEGAIPPKGTFEQIVAKRATKAAKAAVAYAAQAAEKAQQAERYSEAVDTAKMIGRQGPEPPRALKTVGRPKGAIRQLNAALATLDPLTKTQLTYVANAAEDAADLKTIAQAARDLFGKPGKKDGRGYQFAPEVEKTMPEIAENVAAASGELIGIADKLSSQIRAITVEKPAADVITPGELESVKPQKQLETVADQLRRMLSIPLYTMKQVLGLPLTEVEESGLQAGKKAIGYVNEARQEGQRFLNFITQGKPIDRATREIIYLLADERGSQNISALNKRRIEQGLPPILHDQVMRLFVAFQTAMQTIGKAAKEGGLWDDANFRKIFMPRMFKNAEKADYELGQVMGKDAVYVHDLPRLFRSIYDLVEAKKVELRMDAAELVPEMMVSVADNIAQMRLLKWAKERGGYMTRGEFQDALLAKKVDPRDWVDGPGGSKIRLEEYRPIAGFVGPRYKPDQISAELHGLRQVIYSGDISIPLQVLRTVFAHPLHLLKPDVWRIAFDHMMVKNLGDDVKKWSPAMQAAFREGAADLVTTMEQVDRDTSLGHSHIENAWAHLMNAVVMNPIRRIIGRQKGGPFDVSEKVDVDPFGVIQFNRWLPAIKRAILVTEINRALALKAKGDGFFSKMSDSEIGIHVASKIEPAMMNGQMKLMGISPRAQSVIRLIFGAPSWNLGIIRSSIGAMSEVYGGLKNGKILSDNFHIRNVLGQLMATAVAAQTINMVVREMRDDKTEHKAPEDFQGWFTIDTGIKSSTKKGETVKFSLLGPAFRYWLLGANVAQAAMASKTGDWGRFTRLEVSRQFGYLLHPGMGAIIDAARSPDLGSPTTAQDALTPFLPILFRDPINWVLDQSIPDEWLLKLLLEGTGAARVTSGVTPVIWDDFRAVKAELEARKKRMQLYQNREEPEKVRAQVQGSMKVLNEWRERWKGTQYWNTLAKMQPGLERLATP